MHLCKGRLLLVESGKTILAKKILFLLIIIAMRKYRRFIHIHKILDKKLVKPSKKFPRGNRTGILT